MHWCCNCNQWKEYVGKNPVQIRTKNGLDQCTSTGNNFSNQTVLLNVSTVSKIGAIVKFDEVF